MIIMIKHNIGTIMMDNKEERRKNFNQFIYHLLLLHEH